MTDIQTWREKRQRQLDGLLGDFKRLYGSLRATRLARERPARPSLDGPALEATVLAMRTSAWYAEFEGARAVNAAILDLEKRFRAIADDVTSEPLSPGWMAEREGEQALASDEDLRAQLLENELWFRRLYAQVVNLDEQGRELPSLRTRVDGRIGLDRALATLRQEATRLVFRDRELLAALSHADRSFLEGLPAVLASVEKSLDEARARIETPEVGSSGRPIRRRASRGPRAGAGELESGRTDGRELVRFLTEVCMKTYLYCDADVMKKLVAYPLSSARHLRTPVLKTLIGHTVDRKLTNAAHWKLDEQQMLDIASQHEVPIGMVIEHWLGDLSR